MPAGEEITVLHYVGYDLDRGGILAVIRALAAEKRFACVLGVNLGFVAGRSAGLPTLAFPPIAGDTIGLATMARARRVARQVQAWLDADPQRMFHGHSRAGLLVALWLKHWGERRVFATVHCFGRQRWFYRWAARRLGDRLLWLSPAMKRHYGIAGAGWDDCAPGCVPQFEGPPARTTAGTDAGLRVGGVGGLVAVKQWDLLLDALSLLPPTVRIHWRHAGSEDGTPASVRTAARLRERSAALGLESRVTWLGEVREMSRFYADIDCLVVPSRWEAFSVSVLEAAAAGVPVLASDASGIRDLVEDAGMGWLFSADSASSLAGELKALANTDRLQTWRFDPVGLRRFRSDVAAEQQVDRYRRVLAP